MLRMPPRHILKNCPKLQNYLKRFQQILDLGTAAEVIVDSADKDPDGDLVEVATFFLEHENFEDNDFDDFNVWICDLFDFFDDPTDTPDNSISNEPQISGPIIDPYNI